jgi:predicted RNA binding protein YcfA (HicA-like mRNA interferase family)
LKILADNGFTRVLKPRGSHIRLGKISDGKYYATTVQMDRKELTIWTINKIIRQSGKPPEEFM